MTREILNKSKSLLTLCDCRLSLNDFVLSEEQIFDIIEETITLLNNNIETSKFFDSLKHKFLSNFVLNFISVIFDFFVDNDHIIKCSVWDFVSEIKEKNIHFYFLNCLFEDFWKSLTLFCKKEQKHHLD